MTPTRLTLIFALFLAITGNFTFFEKVTAIYPWAENAPFLISIGIVLSAVFALFISLTSIILPVRVTITALLLGAAAIGYFQDQFGTVIDTDMIRNMLETNTAEAGDLLSSGIIFRILLLGILPVALIWLLPFSSSGIIKELRYSLQTITASLVVAIVCMVPFSDTYASFFRNHKPLRYYTNPTYPIYSAIKYAASSKQADAAAPLQELTQHAQRPEDDEHKELIIVVVGETARADHFSLNGYSRSTNPLLEKEKNLISYTNISSCGTSTAISVPCMFAFSEREKFDVETAGRTENILDVLAKANVNVLWRDNNSSSKGVAERVSYQDFRSPDINPVCDEECRDIGMLSGLQEYIDQQQEDILIVLHQMGSHGPAYFKRYPQEYEKFTPVCTSAELSECSEEQIVNTYDNTILYTDYFLSQVIELLKKNSQRHETAMFYISDHGESLGENGIYLHGMPYMFAPDTQTHVPMIVWIGPSSDLDYQTTVRLKDEQNSHDAITTALLDAFEIETDTSLRKTNTPTLFQMKPDH